MKSARTWMTIVAIVALVSVGACDGSGDGSNGTGAGDATNNYDPYGDDTGPSTCTAFCSAVADCELPVPDCQNRCGGFRGETKSCVVDASGCEDIRSCFGSPPPIDAQTLDSGTRDTAEANDTDTTLDTFDATPDTKPDTSLDSGDAEPDTQPDTQADTASADQ